MYTIVDKIWANIEQNDFVKDQFPNNHFDWVIAKLVLILAIANQIVQIWEINLYEIIDSAINFSHQDFYNIENR